MPTTTAINQTQPVNGSSARSVSAAAQLTRRRRGRIALGALVICITVLAAVVFYGSVGDRRAVLAIARPVTAGETIAAADLTVARVSTDPALAPVPAREQRSVVGQVAAVDLVPGTLLSRRSLASGPAVPEGMAVTGALLKPGQYPSALRTGDRVLLVALPADATTPSTGANASPNSPALGEATVFAMEHINDASSGTSISLVVPEERAADIAAVGAAQRLSLVVVSS